MPTPTTAKPYDPFPSYAHLFRPTSLSIGALDSLQKHLKAIEALLKNEVKRHPDKKYALETSLRCTTITYLDVSKCHHYRACQAAAKRDKGEVLWTVFKPTRNGCQEIIRTPHRTITYHWYKNYSDAGYHRAGGTEEDCTQVHRLDNDPWGSWDFARAMTPDEHAN